MNSCIVQFLSVSIICHHFYAEYDHLNVLRLLKVLFDVFDTLPETNRSNQETTIFIASCLLVAVLYPRNLLNVLLNTLVCLAALILNVLMIINDNHW